MPDERKDLTLTKKRWPWATLVQILRDAFYESEVTSAVRNLARDVDAWRRTPVPDPFVSILASGEGPDGVPLMLGKSGRATEGGSYLEIDTYQALKHVSVVVFCDLERVSVESIRIGKDAANCGGTSCPGATFPEWELGVRLGVYVRRLDGAR